jgi:hypothetical protein
VAEDVVQLEARNEEFIAACRAGSWARLRPLLDEGFLYLDGGTGQTWDLARYAADLRANPAPSLWIDELVVHVAGQTATVSARTHSDSRPGRANRYLDTYVRRGGSWRCVHACVWPLLPDEQGRTT